MVSHALDGKHHPKNATSGKETGNKTEVGGSEGIGQVGWNPLTMDTPRKSSPATGLPR